VQLLVFALIFSGQSAYRFLRGEVGDKQVYRVVAALLLYLGEGCLPSGGVAGRP